MSASSSWLQKVAQANLQTYRVRYRQELTSQDLADITLADLKETTARIASGQGSSAYRTSSELAVFTWLQRHVDELAKRVFDDLDQKTYLVQPFQVSLRDMAKCTKMSPAPVRQFPLLHRVPHDFTRSALEYVPTGALLNRAARLNRTWHDFVMENAVSLLRKWTFDKRPPQFRAHSSLDSLLNLRSGPVKLQEIDFSCANGWYDQVCTEHLKRVTMPTLSDFAVLTSKCVRPLEYAKCETAYVQEIPSLGRFPPVELVIHNVLHDAVLNARFESLLACVKVTIHLSDLLAWQASVLVGSTWEERLRHALAKRPDHKLRELRIFATRTSSWHNRHIRALVLRPSNVDVWIEVTG